MSTNPDQPGPDQDPMDFEFDPLDLPDDEATDAVEPTEAIEPVEGADPGPDFGDELTSDFGSEPMAIEADDLGPEGADVLGDEPATDEAPAEGDEALVAGDEDAAAIEPEEPEVEEDKPPKKSAVASLFSAIGAMPVYTWMLAVSLVVILAAVGFLALELQQYEFDIKAADAKATMTGG